MAAKTYIVYNSAMALTAPPVKQTTGTATRTMLQLKPDANTIIRPVAWGCSFDATSGSPGTVELIETDTGGTMTTAFGVNDIQPYNDANAPANTAGASGAPLNLATSASGFTSGIAPVEGTPTLSRMCDLQLVNPASQYVYTWPSPREFECKPGRFLRVRATFAVAVNMITWVIFET